MKKNQLLTCLLMLIATLGIAQTTRFPIVLTTADGLPGSKVVRNCYFQSETYTLDEAVSTLRFTVISTNTTDSLTSGSFDGYSQDWGTGFPFFAMSEFRIYDGTGRQIEYIASGNAVAPDEGDGIVALSDRNESTYLHTVYSRGPLPHAYHYLEFELIEPVTSFSFNLNTRSDYHKSLITYMGITPGTQFLPFPEQEFQLGEQVTTTEELAEEGALFVIRSNSTADYTYPDFDRTGPVLGQVYMHSPCGGAETPSAAQLVYLTPDANVENGYKVTWLNNGHHMIKPELNGSWFHWTNDILKAGTVTFAPCDTVEGAFVMSMSENAYEIAYDALGKMALVKNDEESKGNRSRPNTYNWNIYKASINGAAIAGELQAIIDDAERRIAEVGGKVEGYDEGEYDALTSALVEAKAIVAKSDVTAAEIITTKRSLNLLTAAYAAVDIWSYIDSIDYITAAIENGDIVVSEAPEWVESSYNATAVANLVATSDAAIQGIDTYQSLADVDATIARICTAIDAFWASKIKEIKQLPFRIGREEDGLPGTNIDRVWIWESPMWLLNKETNNIRLTVFKTHSGRNINNKPFVCINEVMFYDQDGNKIPLTEENFMTNSVEPSDGMGLAGLCDGDYTANTGTHFHSLWTDYKGYDASEFFYLEITFPYEISGFKYVQYGRGNGYDDVPTDFVFGYAGETVTPTDVYYDDPYNPVLGDKITDISQITDDGIYAIKGLISCDPDNHFDTGQQKPHFYSGTKAYGELLYSPCAFSITRTGDEDGSFYIQSLSNGRYWSRAIDVDGWSYATDTYNKEEAAKVLIKPNNNAGLPNSFVLYQYIDTVKRNDQPHPYVVFEDWGDSLATFSLTSLENNDKDGEGEWYIYKMTMDNAYVYWLSNLVATIDAIGLKESPDPGCYADLGSFPETLAAAQKAVASENNVRCKELVTELNATFTEALATTCNPMVAGTYVIESADTAFFATQGVHKTMLAYEYNGEEPEFYSEYMLYWGDAPEGNYKDASDYYKFEFIPATESEELAIMLDDGFIDSVQAANAYYIKSIAYNKYIGARENLSQAIGLTDTPETFYIVRQQTATIINLWNPTDRNFSLHAKDHNNGRGNNGKIVYWTNAATPSHWRLRRVDNNTSISDLLSIDDITTLPGRNITLPVNVTNTEAVTAFQIDLKLPEGVEFISATLSDDRKTETHSLSTSTLANGKRRIIAYSNENKTFKHNAGTLLNINVSIPGNTADGDYKVEISNIRLIKPDSKEIILAPASSTITIAGVKGDANGDGEITMGDVVAIANYILLLHSGTFDTEVADINGDGEITMGDLVAIINLILYPDDYDYGRNAKRGVMAASGAEISLPDTRCSEDAVSIPVSLNNTMAYTAFQMDIELPEGAKLTSATASERAAGHSVAWSCLPDGKMRVVAYSLDNEVFSGNAGELLALNIEADGAVSGAISVENVRMVTATGDEYAIGNCGSLLDINGTTGIGAVDGNSLKVYTADGALIVESGKAMKAAVYSASGKLVKTLDVAEGKNVYEGIPTGTYVVAGVKVAIK